MKNNVFSSHVPSYVSIYNVLYRDIINNVYVEGSILPSENVLAKKYNVSRNTLRQALDILSEDGLIVKSQGKGTVVAKRNVHTHNKRIFNPMITLCNEEISDIEVYYNYSKPTDIAKAQLSLIKSDIVIASDLVYKVGKTVVGYAFVQVPTKMFDFLDVDVSQKSGIHDLLNQEIYDVAVRQSLRIQMISANEQEAKYLKVKESTPLLMIKSILYHANYGPFARCKFYFIPEWYKLKFTISAL